MSRVTPGPHVLTTYSGRQLNLGECSSDSIFVVDIAAALSKICRFGAQARVFYSVAQHAVLVHDILTLDLERPDLASYALHHDSHEAFAGDIPSPLKTKLNDEGNDAYARICDRLDAAISEAFDFVTPHEGSADQTTLKLADRSALVLEARTLLHDGGARVEAQVVDGGFALDQLILTRTLEPPLPPPAAEGRFLAAHRAAATP